MNRPCRTLTVTDDPGGTVIVNASPIARRGATVRLEGIDQPGSRWIFLGETCRHCGHDVAAHVLDAYRQGRAMAIERARALAAFDAEYMKGGK